MRTMATNDERRAMHLYIVLARDWSDFLDMLPEGSLTSGSLAHDLLDANDVAIDAPPPLVKYVERQVSP
jgi:hypothetical protein